MTNISNKIISNKIVVIAIGGNALATDDGCNDAQSQSVAAVKTAAHIVDAVKAGFKVILTHGNGPQVGFILERSELAKASVPVVPMDYATADTQGSIGYMFQRALHNEFVRRGMLSHQAQSIVTQVIVNPKDPAFLKPSKPIGGYMNKILAQQLAHENNWQVMEDAGRGWRRCVPSPKPQEIVEIEVIKELLETNTVIIAAGGGGIPVMKNADGTLQGVEAVIDKDLSSCLLAKQLHAEKFVVVTAVEKVAIFFGTPKQAQLGQVSVAKIKQYNEEGHFPAGSMGPKIAAVIDFVESTRRTAIITDIANLADALQGAAGTIISP